MVGDGPAAVVVRLSKERLNVSAKALKSKIQAAEAAIKAADDAGALLSVPPMVQTAGLSELIRRAEETKCSGVLLRASQKVQDEKALRTTVVAEVIGILNFLYLYLLHY